MLDLLGMLKEYYKFPLDLKNVFNNEALSKCGIGESISQNIQLILYSFNGEHIYNYSLGCEIWELDFDLIMNIRVWEERLRKSLMNAIVENLISIENVDIEVKVSEVEIQFERNEFPAIKRQVDVYLKAIIRQTGENYHFHTNLYLSPISTH